MPREFAARIADAAARGPAAIAAELGGASLGSEVVAVDQALRHALPWTLRPEDAVAAEVPWLCALTCHGNGFVREPALREITRRRPAEALPFVLVRLTDWVDPVRVAATEALERYLAPDRAGALVAALPLLALLGRRSRGAALARVREVLSLPEARGALLQGLASPETAVRLAVAHLLGDLDPAGSWWSEALDDPDPRVRLLAIARIPDVPRAPPSGTRSRSSCAPPPSTPSPSGPAWRSTAGSIGSTRTSPPRPPTNSTSSAPR